jgi:antibiotic biosynthesis monooxygenase
MVLTVLEGQVPLGQQKALEAAFQAAGTLALPAGLLRTELIQDARDATRWRIQTLWASRGALDAMRSAGTPAGVLMFRAAGVEPVLSIFDVVSSLPRADG